MHLCAGIKRDGGRCTVSVPAGQQFCHHHDPARASERVRAASKAGRARPNAELRQVRAFVGDITDRVLRGEVDPATAHAVVALQNTTLRAIQLERKLDDMSAERAWEEFKADVRDALQGTYDPNAIVGVLRGLVR